MHLCRLQWQVQGTHCFHDSPHWATRQRAAPLTAQPECKAELHLAARLSESSQTAPLIPFTGKAYFPLLYTVDCKYLANSFTHQASMSMALPAAAIGQGAPCPCSCDCCICCSSSPCSSTASPKSMPPSCAPIGCCCMPSSGLPPKVGTCRRRRRLSKPAAPNTVARHRAAQSSQGLHTHRLYRVKLDEESSDPRLVRQDRPRQPAPFDTPSRLRILCAAHAFTGFCMRQASSESSGSTCQ